MGELCAATGLADKLALIEPLLEVDLSEEGDRFKARDAISAVLRPGFRSDPWMKCAAQFRAACWGPYQTFQQMVSEDPRCSERNSMFSMLEQPGIGRYLVPGSPLCFRDPARGAASRADARRAYRPGAGRGPRLERQGNGELRDKRIVGGPIHLTVTSSGLLWRAGHEPPAKVPHQTVQARPSEPPPAYSVELRGAAWKESRMPVDDPENEGEGSQNGGAPTTKRQAVRRQ